jgi:hypothetical protein
MDDEERAARFSLDQEEKSPPTRMWITSACNDAGTTRGDVQRFGVSLTALCKGIMERVQKTDPKLFYPNGVPIGERLVCVIVETPCIPRFIARNAWSKSAKGGWLKRMLVCVWIVNVR